MVTKISQHMLPPDGMHNLGGWKDIKVYTVYLFTWRERISPIWVFDCFLYTSWRCTLWVVGNSRHFRGTDSTGNKEMLWESLCHNDQNETPAPTLDRHIHFLLLCNRWPVSMCPKSEHHITVFSAQSRCQPELESHLRPGNLLFQAYMVVDRIHSLVLIELIVAHSSRSAEWLS